MAEDEAELEIKEEKKSPRTKIAIIVIGVVLVIAAIIAALSNDTVRAKLGMGDDEGVILTEKVKKEGLDPGVLSNSGDSADAKGSGEFALEGDENEPKAPSVEDAMNEQPSSTTTSTPDKGESVTPPSGEVQRKKFYIGCAAVANKETAEKMAMEMRRKGFDNAGYFYIPDYDPSGKDLYRIYVGPFESVESAEEMAVNVRSESPSAYTFFLK